ncbi:MAG: LysR substrate-binding domain-containing protein [Paracoccaceae bacterium]
MEKMTLKQLRYFEALAQHGHFGRAADVAGISQPALSVQIKELETTLGVPLFERSPGQVRLTPFGEQFGERARNILSAVADLTNLARSAQDAFVGRLRIGVIPTVAPYLLPAVFGALRRSYPGLDVQVRETLTPTLIEELGAGRIDTAIVALPVDDDWLTVAPLFEEDIMLVRPISEAGTPVPDAQSLRQMPLLLLEEGHCFRDQALNFCDISPQGRRERLEGSSLSTLVQMVAAGIGVTLIPQMAVRVEAGAAAVAIDAFPSPQPGRSLAMVWRRSNPLARQLTEVADVVRRAGQSGRSVSPAPE